MPETSSQIEVHAPPGITYATVWDASRYPEFLTDVVDAEVTPGPTATLQRATLRQRLVREVEFSLAMEGAPNGLVTWRLVDGGGWLDRYEGAWTLTPADDNRSVTLRCHLEISFVQAVPDAVMRRLFDFAVPTMMRQVKARAELVARRAEALIL